MAIIVRNILFTDTPKISLSNLQRVAIRIIIRINCLEPGAFCGLQQFIVGSDKCYSCLYHKFEPECIRKIDAGSAAQSIFLDQLFHENQRPKIESF
jgi:hypothetical protein